MESKEGKTPEILWGQYPRTNLDQASADDESCNSLQIRLLDHNPVPPSSWFSKMSVPSPCRSSGAHGSVRLIHRAPLPDGQQVWLCVACQGSASIYHFADAKNGGGVVTREWLCLALELSVANWPLTGPNSQEYASPRGHPWGAGPDNAQSGVG